jgi:hypothetical protein
MQKKSGFRARFFSNLERQHKSRETAFIYAIFAVEVTYVGQILHGAVQSGMRAGVRFQRKEARAKYYDLLG